MNDVSEYKALLDKLANLNSSVTHKLTEFRAKGVWPTLEREEDRHAIESLSSAQRAAIEAMLTEMVEVVTHDVLVILKDGKYQIEKNGKKLPTMPFGNPINYDYMMRRLGQPWPDEA